MPFQNDLLTCIKILTGLFWGPSLEQCGELLQAGYWDPFVRILEPSGNEPKSIAVNIESMLATYSNAETLFDDMEDEYVRLFISHRNGIAAPLYQSCYESEAAGLMERPAIMMRERIQKSGLSLSSDLKEPPDHLSVELEYLYYLLQKGPKQKDYLKTVGDFAREEMLPFVTALKNKVPAQGDSLFYLLILQLLKDLLIMISTSRRSLF